MLLTSSDYRRCPESTLPLSITMLWSTRYINRSNALCALLLLCQRIAGTGLIPRDVTAVEVIARRVCDSAAPDVSESSVRLLQLAIAPLLTKSRLSPVFAIRLLPMTLPHVPTKCQRFGLPSQIRSCADGSSGPHTCKNLPPIPVVSIWVSSPTA